MPSRVQVEFEGDADGLVREARRAQEATTGVGDAALESSRDMERAADSTGGMGDRLSKLGNTVTGALGALDGLTAGIETVADVMDSERQANAKLERALIDVEQARNDLTQATLDGSQAILDGQQAVVDEAQAQLDLKDAIKEHADAVAEYGANSSEAEQALIDQKQAEVDLNQARQDGNQALADGTQATIDSRTATQDLADAQHELDPGPLQMLADKVTTFLPLVNGLVSVVALATAAQWTLNLAWLASPITWIVLAIAGLIAVIVLIATKTTWFKDLWNAAWNWIKDTASNVWNWIKQIPGWIASAFSTISNAITAPFRGAFNAVANLWNRTLGSLSWTVPGWVPFIGGNTISVPKLPTFHTGGIVPGNQGQEMMAILQAGERITPAGSARGGNGGVIDFSGNVDSAFATAFMKLVRSGDIQIATG